MGPTSTILLVAAPDHGLRRSLEFALGVEGYAVDAHASLLEALASPLAAQAVCAVVDEDALARDGTPPQALRRLVMPVILLLAGSSLRWQMPGMTVLTKPFQGGELIELIKALSVVA